MLISLAVCLSIPHSGEVGMSPTDHLFRAMIEKTTTDKGRRRELFGFLFLTVLLAPAVAVAVVAGYGMLIWTYQLFQGPPTY